MASTLATSSRPMLHWMTSVAKLAPAFLTLGLFAACVSAPAATTEKAAIADTKPAPVTTQNWSHATISVTDIDRTAKFFREIGKYETVWRGQMGWDEREALGLPEGASAEEVWLRAPGAAHSLLRIVDFDNAGPQVPTRPGARAWDTGCYWSIMVRAKGLEAVYNDAVAMGWWSQTPITQIDFGGVTINIIVLQGPDGVQVQAYERVGGAVPEGFTPFERISQPFNIMQMSKNRDAAEDFMVNVLGFETFFAGPPHVDEAPSFMPLGIPKNLTTTVPYKAGIFYPQKSEYGRMEYIEIDGLDGHDFSSRCTAPNLGILAVSYPVEDVDAAFDVVD